MPTDVTAYKSSHVVKDVNGGNEGLLPLIMKVDVAEVRSLGLEIAIVCMERILNNRLGSGSVTLVNVFVVSST